MNIKELNILIILIIALIFEMSATNYAYCDQRQSNQGSIDDNILAPPQSQTGPQDPNHPGKHQRQSDGKWINN